MDKVADTNRGDADNQDNDNDVGDEVAVDPVPGEEEHAVADLETVISPIKVITGSSRILQK